MKKLFRHTSSIKKNVLRKISKLSEGFMRQERKKGKREREWSGVKKSSEEKIFIH